MRLPLSIFSQDLLVIFPEPQGGKAFRVRCRRDDCRVIESLPLPSAAESDAAPDDRLKQEFGKRGWRRLPCILGVPSGLLSTHCLPWSGSGVERSVRRRVRAQTDEFEALSETRALTAYNLASLGSTRRLVVYTAREDAIQREVRRLRAAHARVVDAVPRSLAFYLGAQAEFGATHAPGVVVHVGPDQTDGMVGGANGFLFFKTLRIGGGSTEGVPDASPAQWRRELSELRREVAQSPTLRPALEQKWIFGGVRLPDEKTQESLRDILNVDFHTVPLGRLADVTARGMVSATRRPGGSTRISLLPADQRIPQLRRTELRYWRAACLIFLASLAGFVFHLRRRTEELERRRDERRETLRLREDALEEMAALRNDHRAMEASLKSFRAHRQGQARMVRLFQAIAEARDAREWFVLFADAESYFEGNGVSNRYPDPSPGLDHFILEGYTPAVDFSTVRRMIEQLKRQEFIRRVDLLPDDQIQSRARLDEQERAGARRFAMEIILEGGDA